MASHVEGPPAYHDGRRSAHLFTNGWASNRPPCLFGLEDVGKVKYQLIEGLGGQTWGMGGSPER